MNAEAIKINLGARDRSIAGFRSMDCDPHPGVDIVGDISNLSMFKDGEVDEIYSSHVLEHFPHARTAAVLKEWARVLKPGGVLYVAVPDFARVVELYQAVGGVTQWIQEYVSGGQEYATAYHYAIFDEAKLESLLREAGFSEVSRVELFPIHGPNDCSTKSSNWDSKPTSLNMVAVKPI